jgi:hypothetical protein
VRELLRELWHLTGGDTAASSKVLRRMRDQGDVLAEAEREIDADLIALKERQKRGPPGVRRCARPRSTAPSSRTAGTC